MRAEGKALFIRRLRQAADALAKEMNADAARGMMIQTIFDLGDILYRHDNTVSAIRPVVGNILQPGCVYAVANYYTGSKVHKIFTQLMLDDPDKLRELGVEPIKKFKIAGEKE